MANEIKTGSYAGTGAAVNVSLGFVPDYIRVVNETDGDIAWEWFRGMTDGHALQAANSDLTQLSKITSNGISAFAGAEAVSAVGFTAGSALSENGKTFRYVAMRSGEGAQ